MSMKKFLVMLLCLPLFTAAKPPKKPIVLSPEKTILLAGVITGAIYEPMMQAFDKLAADNDTIDMVISSPGGEVIAGSLIIDRMEQLRLSGVKFRCVVRDVAASMAFQILLHCDERYATPHSFLLWHPVRIFMRDVVTASIAQTLTTQLAEADEVALHDLRAHLPMPESELVWHFQNETLHQGINLMGLAPGFFKDVTNSIENLYPKKPLLDTSSFGNMFGHNQIIYVHERFMK
jgi:ATP-dependent protease ClpP protease subunit